MYIGEQTNVLVLKCLNCRNWSSPYRDDEDKMSLYVRGFFKIFCYERLSIRKNSVCWTDFLHKYSSFYHTCACEISKESSKYQSSYWHLKWPQSYTLAHI